MLYAIIGVLVLLVDQFMKYWTVSNIELNTGLQKLIPGVIHLTHIKNFGAVFGILKNAGWLRWVALLLLLAVTAAMVLAFRKGILRSALSRWSGALLLAGLLGNGIDRALFGYVVDMLEFDFGSFAIFNLADCLVLFAGILFCISVFTGGVSFSAEEDNAPRSRRSMEEPPSRRRPVEEDMPVRRRTTPENIAGQPIRPRRPMEETEMPRRRPVEAGAQPQRRRPVESEMPQRPRQPMDETEIPRRRPVDAGAQLPRRRPVESEMPQRPRRPVEEAEMPRRRPVDAAAQPSRRRPVESEMPQRPRRPIEEGEMPRRRPVDASAQSSRRLSSEDIEMPRRRPVEAGEPPARPRPAAQQPRPEPGISEKKPSESFDLDSILAEFNE